MSLGEPTQKEVVHVLVRWILELQEELDDARYELASGTPRRVAEMERWMRSGLTPAEIMEAACELDPVVVGAA